MNIKSVTFVGSYHIGTKVFVKD